MSPSPFRVLLLLSLLTVSCSGRLGQVHEEEVSGDAPVSPEISTVRAEVRNGSLSFRPIPARVVRYAGSCQMRADTEAQLEVLKGIEARLEIVRDGGTLVLRTPPLPERADPMRTMVAYRLVLEMPADLALEVTASRSGHLSVQGWQAPVRLDSAHGDLELGNCTGGATLRTGFREDGAGGGDSSTGGRTLVYGHGGDLDVQAISGAIQAWVEDPGDLVRLVTGSGSIQCKVPPDRAFRVEARTQRGKVTNGFGLPERQLDDYGAAIEGAVGTGGTRILLRTGAGSISLGVQR